MSKVQVLLDAADVDRDDLLGTAQTLLREVRKVQLVNAPSQVRQLLVARFGHAIAPVGRLRPGVPLVVVSGGVAFAAGSLRRLDAHSRMPGRCLTRVLLPGLGGAELLSCWSAQWLDSYDGPVAALVAADLTFDREHLPTASPRARAWVLPEEIGVALVADVGSALSVWQRRAGIRLQAAQWWDDGVRAHAGTARRRFFRWQQRRQRATLSRAGR